MTYEEAMEILDETPEESFCSIAKYRQDIPMAILYVKNRTHCNQEIAERIVFEILDFSVDIKPIEKPTIVECPYCKSTNTKKIGAVKRSLSFSLLGFGSGSIGKQWKCNSCGSCF